MADKKCGSWIRANSETIEWRCSICGYTLQDSLRKTTCDCCGSTMYLGEPENKRFMDEKAINAIESFLKKGDRVELIPVKDGVKIMHIKREEVKIRDR